MSDPPNHKEKSKKKLFCSNRPKSCTRHGQSYRQNGKPKGAQWPSYEAHHILPCACVTSTSWPKDAKKRRFLEDVLNGTDWCINREKNMIPLPIFGETVRYYCNVSPLTSVAPSAGIPFNAVVNPPPFANWPQHNFEHNSKEGYNYEVSNDVREIWEAMEGMDDPHEIKPEPIIEWLDYLSDKWRGELTTRGLREGGTHVAWMAAKDQEPKKWYLPFSMADAAHAEVRHKPFTFTYTVKKKIMQLVKAMTGGGAG